MTLKRKTLIFTLILLFLTLFLVGSILVVRMRENFSMYLALEQDARVNDLVNQIEPLFSENGGLNALRLDALAKREKLHLRFISARNEVVQEMNHISEDAVFKGTLVERDIPIFDSLHRYVGSIRMSYWDQSLLSQSVDAFNRSMVTTVSFSVILGLLFSAIASMAISESITKPIEIIQQQTKKMRAGQYDEVIHTQGFTQELQSLGENINQLSQALDTQEQSRKKYAQDISHELRTPVTALKLQLSAMKDGIRESNGENIQTSLDEVDRLNRLIEMLKASFENERSLNEIQYETIHLKDLVSELSASIGPYITSDGTHFDIDVDQKATLSADKNHLTRILYNLLSNAKKAVSAGGHVKLSVQQKKQRTIITVQDDGVGISQDELPHIFERFYRVDSARNTKMGGTGLGLAIVKSLVHEMHGTIDVTSALGHGSTFTVELPTQPKQKITHEKSQG